MPLHAPSLRATQASSGLHRRTATAPSPDGGSDTTGGLALDRLAGAEPDIGAAPYEFDASVIPLGTAVRNVPAQGDDPGPAGRRV